MFEKHHEKSWLSSTSTTCPTGSPNQFITVDCDSPTAKETTSPVRERVLVSSERHNRHRDV